MVEILKAILFGIVEGITEWLPISSTGHLILLDEFVKLQVSEEFSSMFEVVIQFGAILAVILLFFRKLDPLDRGKSEKLRYKTWRLWMLVIVAIIPSGILGLLLDDWMDEHLHNYQVVSAMLILYGAAFILMEKRNALRPAIFQSVYEMDLKTALLIGCFQALSLVPGTSRSGATILGASVLGVGRSAGAEFSFFMAIPTMLGASVIKTAKFIASGVGITGLEVGILLTGCAVSFLVSMLVIRGLMAYIRDRSFAGFGVYRIVLGIAVLAYFGLVK
ncbi:MAG: undecaprenyl-diphosphate phosphatase [Clostridia bacterium]|nr:undecaprenyl-diphosphate phosphatase [Clostridia bacterium]